MPESMSERVRLSLWIHAFIFVALAALMSGCTSHNIQTTSGKAYLAKYKAKSSAEEGAAQHRSEPDGTAHAPFDHAQHLPPHPAGIEA